MNQPKVFLLLAKEIPLPPGAPTGGLALKFRPVAMVEEEEVVPMLQYAFGQHSYTLAWTFSEPVDMTDLREHMEIGGAVGELPNVLTCYHNQGD